MGIASRRLLRTKNIDETVEEPSEHLGGPVGMSIPGTRLAYGTPEQLATDLDNVVRAGAEYLRFDIAWIQIEGTQGSPNWSNIDRIVAAAEERNLKMLGIITTMADWAREEDGDWRYGPTTAVEWDRFAAFAAAVATRYQGKFVAYEIWNEANLDQFWAPTPNPTHYAELFKKTSTAIRAVDTETPILTTGTGGAGSAPDIASTTFVTALYDEGCSPYLDGVAVHPYVNIDGTPLPNGEMQRAIEISNLMVDRGDGDKLLWGTEVGAPTDGSAPVMSEQEQAAFVVDAYEIWRNEIPNAGPLFWYTLVDTGGTDREGYFGLIRTDGTDKPAFEALQTGIVPTPMTTLMGGYGPWAGTYEDAEETMTNVSTAMGFEVMHGHFFFDHRWGWSVIEGDQTMLNTWGAWKAAKAGRSVSISVPLLPASTDGGTTQDPAYGDFAGLAAGDYDSHFTALGQALASGGNWDGVILRLGWEFNGDGWAWSPTNDTTSGSLAQAVADFKTGFARAAAAIRAELPSARVMWCPSLGYDAIADYSLEDLYPSDTAVDIVGFGAYDYNLNVTNYADDEAGQLQRWNDNWSKPNGFQDMVDLAQAHNKALAHVEWGLWPTSYLSQQGGGDDPVYISKLAEYFTEYNVELSVYNNSTAEHQLQSYPNAQAEFRVVMRPT